MPSFAVNSRPLQSALARRTDGASGVQFNSIPHAGQAGRSWGMQKILPPVTGLGFLEAPRMSFHWTAAPVRRPTRFAVVQSKRHPMLHWQDAGSRMLRVQTRNQRSPKTFDDPVREIRALIQIIPARRGDKIENPGLWSAGLLCRPSSRQSNRAGHRGWGPQTVNEKAKPQGHLRSGLGCRNKKPWPW